MMVGTFLSISHQPLELDICSHHLRNAYLGSLLVSTKKIFYDLDLGFSVVYLITGVVLRFLANITWPLTPTQ